MYGERPIEDLIRAIKAIFSNVLAGFLPRLYVRLTKQTGRGSESESSEKIADYFECCFYEYFQKLNISNEDIQTFLNGKRIMEYGPGDVPGVALLMFAHNAKHVSCVDRFPLVNLSDTNVAVIKCMINKLQGDIKTRAESSLVDVQNIKLGFRSECIEYLVQENGLSNYNGKIDLIYSRAVLEHVNDLQATISDIYTALSNHGVAIHQVDLKSHGLHRTNELDFLTWPAWLWNLMYSNKGMPNRWRVNKYLELIDKTSMEISMLEPTAIAELHEVKLVYPHIKEHYGSVTEDQLSWLGFWLVLTRSNTIQ